MKTLKQFTDNETKKGNFVKLERYLKINAPKIKQNGNYKKLKNILPVNVDGVVLKKGVDKIKNGKNVIEYKKK